jgi:hypothetical protein
VQVRPPPLLLLLVVDPDTAPHQTCCVCVCVCVCVLPSREGVALADQRNRQAHNRYWAEETVYAKANGGAFDFLIDSARQGAVPIDPTFWDALFAQPAAAWGLRVYEQVCDSCVMGSRMRLQLLNASICCVHLMMRAQTSVSLFHSA